MPSRNGYEEEEIEEVFAKYDIDGDQILDHVEQAKMMEELQRAKVNKKSFCFFTLRSFSIFKLNSQIKQLLFDKLFRQC